jgi:hypothetical protein
MRKFLTPTKDATLYQRYPTNNSGLDEILEVGKVKKPEDIDTAYSSSAARSVLYFDLTDSGSIPTTASYFLNLKIANATTVRMGQELLVYNISSSWTEGSGYFYQDIVNENDGATWQQSSQFVSWSNAGGDITTVSQSVLLDDYPMQDLHIDVTSLVSSSHPWYGLLVKFPDTSEYDSNNAGNIKFFSKQTHTVHCPTLEIAWDDTTRVTGSFTAIPNTVDITVVSRNPKEKYIKGSIEKIQLVTRDKYPSFNFDTVKRYKKPLILVL